MKLASAALPGVLPSFEPAAFPGSVRVDIYLFTFSFSSCRGLLPCVVDDEGMDVTRGATAYPRARTRNGDSIDTKAHLRTQSGAVLQ